LAHPLIDAQGAAQTAPSIQGQMAINLPDLAPFAALARIDLRGQSKLNARADVGNEVALAVEGTLGVTGGMAPIPGLIGDAAKLKVAATLHGQDITLSEFSVDGKTLQASANGSVAQGRLAADWKLALSDLAVVAPNLGGNLSMHGTAQGVPDDVSAVVDLSGRIAAAHIPPGPVQAHIEAQHLPGGIDAKVAAQGELDRDPLTLRAAVNQKPDGLALTIDQASWKSLDARGAVTLPKGAFVPIGNLDFRMTRLEDLRPFVNQPITGSINGAIESTANQARMTLDVRDAGLPQARVARAKLDATVANPVDHPTLDGRLVVSKFSAGGIGGDATLEARGPQDALGLRLTAGVHNLQGADAQMQAQSVLNLPGKEISISSLQASWKGESLRLLSPARVAFGDGIVVDRLRAGIGQAVLDVAGRASPAVDLTVSLRNVTPELAAPFVPGLQADGRISAEAKLKGAPAQLSGTARIEAAGLKMRTGPGRALPPADLRISADLRAGTARIDGRLIAGRVTNFTLTGTAPVMRQGALDLRAGGRIDLAMLNPLLAANGQRISGQVALNTTITGAPNAPRVGGTVQLANGEVEDYAHGARLGDMAALIRAEGDTIRIVRFTARAGKGTIEASGTVGILAARLPVDISLTARNATPVASDLITATLNADLSLRGQAREHLEAAGRIVIVRAEIHIPEKLPPSIQTLDVRRPGQKPPPPPSGPALEIALNLSFRADQIFVRGRGIDAELGGTVRVTGTANNPVPIGSFEMRRGQISVAGTTLRFTKGEVSFNGGSLADPSLDFTATSTTSSIIASLHVGGTASDPKITLSSTPELPQDEVLAHLLFGRSTDTLSPFQVASIALALAELTGVAPGVGDPLEQARRGLGLDVLRLGSGPGGNPNLEAGRYLAPGVFLGARQGTSSNSTQGTIQFDLAKGLKLDAFVGTGQASNISGAPPTESQGSGVGLTYQFEY
ncbi:MAG: translocation/assembly module TamB domain-containing protein, partial [Acetobacteraceae bacterium]|nr:translocation/assembly module TamB domain-containing protein [Acetobacteraceae bacterium]